MDKTQLPEHSSIQPAARFREETERACLALVEAQLEVAFTFVRRAESEIGDGNGAGTAELIAKAIATHNMAVKYLANVPVEFEEEKRKLYIAARKLFEASRAAARLRKQPGSSILSLTQSTQA